jgi:hypothetical protein
MSCGQNSDVNGNGIVSADAFDFPLLQYPQKCDLNVSRQVADFIQEDCAAICRFKTAQTSLGRPGKGSLLVPEKLGSNQGWRNGCAVDADGLPIYLPQGDLIGKRLNIRGFWMYYEEFLPKIREALTEATQVVASGRLSLTITATYKPFQIKEAIEHYQRGGKVLLDFTDAN